MIYAVILMLVLQVADWWTTRRFLRAGKQELNPVMRWVINKFGTTALLIVKLVIGGTATLVLYSLGWFWPLIALCAVYAIVVWNNWRIV